MVEYLDKTGLTYLWSKIKAHTGSGLIGYGTSSTAAATVQKEVSIPQIKTLAVGQVIVVRPSVTSNVANSTLKVNDFDAYPMRYNNAAITTSTDSVVWNANFPSFFLFDGIYWIFLGHGLDSNTTYSAISLAEITTGTATSSRTVTAKTLNDWLNEKCPATITDTEMDNVLEDNSETNNN